MTVVWRAAALANLARRIADENPPGAQQAAHEPLPAGDSLEVPRRCGRRKRQVAL